MKKKLLKLGVFLMSVVISLAIGVLAFSADNVKNATSGAVSLTLTEGDGLALVGWEKGDDGKYVSGENASIVLVGIGTYVNNIRIDGVLDTDVSAVEVMLEVDDGFMPRTCPVSVKNDDIYVSIGEYVDSMRICVYFEEGRVLSLNKVEINPTGLNVDTVLLILAFVFPLVIGYSVLEMIFDRASLKRDIFAMKRYKYLLGDLVAKDVKTKYRRSALGVLWSVLNPLLMMAVLTAVFSNIIRVEVEGGFALFYLTGYIIFNFISEATGFALYTITSAAPLIKKVYIPKYVFPLEKCIFSLVNMIFSLIAFVIVFVLFCITGRVTPHITMLMFPIPIILVFLFCLGICLILAAVMVFFRDIGHIWGILLTVWMYASPIIYPIDILPAWLRGVLRLNPLTHYIDYFRSVMIYGRIPSLSENLICVLFSLSSLFIGVVIFRKKQDKFLLHI